MKVRERSDGAMNRFEEGRDVVIEKLTRAVRDEASILGSH